MYKKLCFETGTHPPFRPMSQNTQFLFFEGFPKVTKPCQGQNCKCCGRNHAWCGHHCVCHGQIWHLRRQKIAFPKVVLYFLGIFNDENTLFSKGALILNIIQFLVTIK